MHSHKYALSTYEVTAQSLLVTSGMQLGIYIPKVITCEKQVTAQKHY